MHVIFIKWNSPITEDFSVVQNGKREENIDMEDSLKLSKMRRNNAKLLSNI